MSGIHVATVRPSHDYTRSSTPWLHDEEAAEGRRTGKRLFHFLSGGGLRAFGRSVRQEEAAERQRRFLTIAGLLFVAWLVLLLV